MEPIYDIAIVGAGPAGIATTISLMRNKQHRLTVALIDKARFPREKVCGDAVPYWVFKELEEICPQILNRMLSRFDPPYFTATKLYTANRRSISVNWSQPGYMIPRIELDHYFLEQIEDCGETDIIEDYPVIRVQREGEFFRLISDQQNQELKARYVIGADGAPSAVSRSLLKDFAHSYRSGSAVRTYFSDLSVPDPKTSLVFFCRKYSPGYFWFFPIGSDRANVGFGMTNKHRQRKKINIKEAFDYFLHEYHDLFGFKQGIPDNYELKGGFLPFSSGVGKMTGKGFTLVGDAAYLNDPLSGDGIRNAVISGILAGKALAKLSDNDHLNEVELIEYQENLKQRLHRELKMRSKAVSLLAMFPGIVQLSTRMGNQSWIIRRAKKWI